MKGKPTYFKGKLPFKEFDTGYLFGDGHLVVVCKKVSRIKGTYVEIKWAEIFECFARPSFDQGRLIIRDSALLELLQGATVSCKVADENQGSENTRARGIKVGTLVITTAKGGYVCISSFPDLISAPYTFQESAIPETFEKNRMLTQWGFEKICKVHCITQRSKEGEAQEWHDCHR